MKKIALAAILSLSILPLASHAGLAKGLVRGAIFGAGATVGHRVAASAIDSVRDAKAKSDKKKQEQSISTQPLPAPQASSAQAVPARK